MNDPRRFRLFACASLLPGEADAALLEAAVHLGPARTLGRYALIDLGVTAALQPSGLADLQPVVGELYEVTAQTLARCDVKHDHPTTFVREEVDLEDGTRAHAYFVRPEQSRGRRRIRGGDWKRRFEVGKPEAGPLVRWARTRTR